MKKNRFFCLAASLFCLTSIHAEEIPFLQNAKEVESFFPSSVEEVAKRAQVAKEDFEKEYKQILEIPLEKRNFANTLEAWDLTSGKLYICIRTLETLPLVVSDTDLKEECQRQTQNLKSVYLQALADSAPLYEGILAIKKTELPFDQDYYAKRVLLELKQAGAALPKEKREEVRKLSVELAELCDQFEENIRKDKSHLFVKKEGLKGLPEDFIQSLEKNDLGEYKLTCQYPVYVPVMSYSTSAETRQKLHFLYNNRAYPQNVELLETIIAKRNGLANLLGYPSFSAYQTSTEMVKTPERAQKFLDELLQNVQPKARAEFLEVTKVLPESVQLSSDGKLHDYDAAFVFSEYKRQNFSIDELAVAEYFPIEKTLKGLLSIYEKFFSLSIKEVPFKAFWNTDVKMLVIQNQKKETLGYILLDLYPREGKYSHACDCPILPAYNSPNGKKYPALDLVVTNFTKPTASKPSLLRYTEVKTFFHEFGHAIHDVLGRTNQIRIAGLNVEMDFVELPSQILEEWLWDKKILQMVSSHYKTGAKLPDSLLDKMIQAKNFDAATKVQRQCFLSDLALAYYAKGERKDTTKICYDLQNKICKEYIYGKGEHFQASFGHLTGYGALYYGYLWSKVFALDVFEKIQKEGLLNPKAGQHYIQTIIGKGGSEDASDMLKAFLGREPSQKAFLESLGIGG